MDVDRPTQQEGAHLPIPLRSSPSLLALKHNGPIKCFRLSHMNTDYIDPALHITSTKPGRT